MTDIVVLTRRRESPVEHALIEPVDQGRPDFSEGSFDHPGGVAPVGTTDDEPVRDVAWRMIAAARRQRSA